MPHKKQCLETCYSFQKKMVNYLAEDKKTTLPQDHSAQKAKYQTTVPQSKIKV